MVPCPVVHGAPPMLHHEPQESKVFPYCASFCSCLKPEKVVRSAKLSYNKPSARGVERKGHIKGVDLFFNMFPANCPDVYVCNAASQVIIYKGNDFTYLTGMFETIGGSNWFITKLNEEKIVIPTIFHGTHCPAPSSRALRK